MRDHMEFQLSDLVTQQPGLFASHPYTIALAFPDASQRGKMKVARSLLPFMLGSRHVAVLVSGRETASEVRRH